MFGRFPRTDWRRNSDHYCRSAKLGSATPSDPDGRGRRYQPASHRGCRRLRHRGGRGAADGGRDCQTACRRSHTTHSCCLGDNVYEDGNPDRLPDTVFGPFEPLLEDGVDLWAVLGNHDVDDGFGQAQLDALSMPGNWYSVEMGDTLLVALNSNLPGHPEQRAWLDRKLANNDFRWTIIIMHHPLYSAGYHGSSNSNREAFLPIIEKHGADLVLSGHDHDYQRSKPQNGTTYIVSGGSARLRETGSAYFTEVSSSQYHFVDLTIFEDRIEVQAIGRDGVFDSVTIE